jgi:methoxymalonate biosynthesis protein
VEPGPRLEKISVLGAGVMGSGITAMILAQGFPVVLIDVSEAILRRAATRVQEQLRHATLLGALPAGQPAATLQTAMSPRAAEGSSAVIEAVTEHHPVKQKVLTEISAVLPTGTPLISNTSGIPVDELAEGLPRPQDLVGAHFMNPAYLIDMVEVARGVRTAPDILTAVESLLAALHRRVVVVADSPGFVTSRLLHPMINDAARIVGEGVASAEAVDALMTECLRHHVGPLRTADLIGLDNLADSLSALYERTGEERFRPCPALLEKVEDGHLGHKTGRGFYDYGRVLS